MLLPASSRCWAEPTARDAWTSARAVIGSAVVWGIVWMIIGSVGPATAVDLDAPITATWSGIGLREWASRVSHIAGLPVLVDRRLDPDTAIRLECREELLLDVLERAAAARAPKTVADDAHRHRRQSISSQPSQPRTELTPFLTSVDSSDPSLSLIV